MTPREKELMRIRMHNRIKGKIQRTPLSLGAGRPPINSTCSSYVRNRLIELEYERRGLLVPEIETDPYTYVRRIVE